MGRVGWLRGRRMWVVDCYLLLREQDLERERFLPSMLGVVPSP